jgi:hypothetical protein
MVAPATLTLEMSTTFVLSESDLILLQSFPAARAFAILNGLAKGLGVSVGILKAQERKRGEKLFYAC